jgi:hypothetical protein
MGEGSTECRDFFDELVIVKEDSASWRQVMSGNVLLLSCKEQLTLMKQKMILSNTGVTRLME